MDLAISNPTALLNQHNVVTTKRLEDHFKTRCKPNKCNQLKHGRLTNSPTTIFEYSKMKQWVTLMDGVEALQIQDLAQPTELGNDEVLVKMSRVSLNYRDAQRE